MTGGRDLGSATGERGAIYRRIGVEPIVNGGTTFTRLGGSLMPVEVVEAMRQAAECFVDLGELQAAVGSRIASRTRNEAAFVSGGAAAGLFLAAAACMTRGTDDGILRPTDLPAGDARSPTGRRDPGASHAAAAEGGLRRRLPRDFIVQAAHRCAYDAAIEFAGGRLLEIGKDPPTSEEELDQAIGPSTAAVLVVAGEHLARGTLPLRMIVRIAARHGVPVLVDAAAQLPPAENLWRFTAAGADLVLFSGGKGLCGPASTGLVLGRAALVERVGRNAAPLHRAGRPMKVGKEDLIGILAAVEWFLDLDHGAVATRDEAVVAHIVAWGAGRDDVAVVREPRGEAGQPTPRARVRLLGRIAASRDAIVVALLAGRPRIHLEPAGTDSLFVAPETLVAGEEQLVTERLGATLDAFAMMAGPPRG